MSEEDTQLAESTNAERSPVTEEAVLEALKEGRVEAEELWGDLIDGWQTEAFEKWKGSDGWRANVEVDLKNAHLYKRAGDTVEAFRILDDTAYALRQEIDSADDQKKKEIEEVLKQVTNEIDKMTEPN